MSGERGASDGPTLFGWFLILGVVILIVQGIGDLLGFDGDEEGGREANRSSLIDDRRDERQDARQERRKRQAQAQAREERLAAERARERQQAAQVQEAEPAPIASAASECDPNYGGCLDPTASDYDCEGGEGDGPAYTGQVEVLGTDVHDLDSDSDGVACEPTS